MPYPVERPRRLRRTETLRALVRETHLEPSSLMKPLFVVPGRSRREGIASLAHQFHLSPDEAVREAEALWRVGVRAVLLFGLPETKDALASSALDPAGPVPDAVRRIKDRLPDMSVATDVCLCEYTDHGHCGIVAGASVANDPTLEVLTAMALVHAEAGADIVAPSDMMDGRVAAIRQGLDAQSLTDTVIMSYAAKFASAFYGPFREAAGSAPAFGDRRSYQMDPANGREALREVALDEAEGADILMVKPAMPYLDVLARARERTLRPLAAYQVSGEYAMLEAAAAAGLIDRRAAAMEALTSIRRSGADILITYYADEVPAWLDA